ncbi:MAG: hypothetical protein KDC45_02575 [Bacteroidetes bacterium]|nr:hypothetical protein [Bacteroidota bacterium]
MRYFSFILLLSALLVSCAEKPRMIPVETFVEIWYQASETDDILKNHELPVHAPEEKLEPLTKPYGYSARDFKYTHEEINRDPALKKKRDQAEFEYLQKKLLERLKESKSLSVPDSSKGTSH